MASPIGVSVSDFISAAKLMKKVITELKEVCPKSEISTSTLGIFFHVLSFLIGPVAHIHQHGEAPGKYQNLVLELETLARVLDRVFKIEPTEHKLVHLDGIRAAATACKRPL